MVGSTVFGPAGTATALLACPGTPIALLGALFGVPNASTTSALTALRRSGSRR